MEKRENSRRRGAITSLTRWLLSIFILFILVAALFIAFKDLNLPSNHYQNFRAEGLSLKESLPSALLYLKKYIHKSYRASDSTVREFKKEGEKIVELGSNERREIEGKEWIRLSFVGDIMWIRNGWNTFLSDSLRQYLQSSHLLFGNLETPIDTLSPVPFILPDYTKYNSPPKLLRSFRREDGTNLFTALSVANNHTIDTGIEGLERTIAFLKSEKIECCGAGSAKEYLIIEKEGIKIGFYAASWGLNEPQKLLSRDLNYNLLSGIAPLDREKINIEKEKRIISEIKREGAEIIVFYLHWGYEFEYYPDPQIVKLGRALAQEGVDIIIGSHPHVIQPDELYYYKGSDGQLCRSYIAYSLGNFTTTMYTKACRRGAIKSFYLYRDTLTGKVIWTIPENRLVYNHFPIFWSRSRVLRLLPDR
ncbi:MAG: CapA family protein [Bacteroidales bacterium]